MAHEVIYIDKLWTHIQIDEWSPDRFDTAITTTYNDLFDAKAAHPGVAVVKDEHVAHRSDAEFCAICRKVEIAGMFPRIELKTEDDIGGEPFGSLWYREGKHDAPQRIGESEDWFRLTNAKIHADKCGLPLFVE